MDCSTPGFPEDHQLPEPTQIHVLHISDAIQPSHPLSSSSPALNLSQHQSLPESYSFPSGGQIIGASASASVPVMNIQSWFPLGLTGWISLQSKELSRVFSSTTVQKHQFFSLNLLYGQHSHLNMTSGTIIALTIRTFVGKVMSQLFNMLSRFVIAFLSRSKYLLISWLSLIVPF